MQDSLLQQFDNSCFRDCTDWSFVFQMQYRDRARERREKFGNPEPPLPRRKQRGESAPVPYVLLCISLKIVCVGRLS